MPQMLNLWIKDTVSNSRHKSWDGQLSVVHILGIKTFTPHKFTNKWKKQKAKKQFMNDSPKYIYVWVRTFLVSNAGDKSKAQQ